MDYDSQFVRFLVINVSEEKNDDYLLRKINHKLLYNKRK